MSRAGQSGKAQDFIMLLRMMSLKLRIVSFLEAKPWISVHCCTTNFILQGTPFALYSMYHPDVAVIKKMQGKGYLWNWAAQWP